MEPSQHLWRSHPPWHQRLWRNAMSCRRSMPSLWRGLASNTVAVWVVRPAKGPALRVVVPISQIFLGENDMFEARKFDPWRQKTIYEYTRRDAADSFELPRPLFDFFLRQADKYAGASDLTL